MIFGVGVKIVKNQLAVQALGLDLYSAMAGAGQHKTPAKSGSAMDSKRIRHISKTLLSSNWYKLYRYAYDYLNNAGQTK